LLYCLTNTMLPTFKQNFFSGNRRRLKEIFIGTAPIVITANGLLQRGGDTTFIFAQDANFWYLTGINDPDIVLVIDKNKEYLIVPERSASRETFDGKLSHNEMTAVSGVSEVYGAEEGWKQLNARLKKVKHVATLSAPPEYIDVYGFYTNPARLHLQKRLSEANNDLELLDLSMHMARMRMLKQPIEIKAIQKAIDITGLALKEATRRTKLSKYIYEYEIEAEITRSMRANGASGHSFAPIVAGGKRSCTVHNLSNDGKLKSKEPVVMDVGAEYEHYAADITRTISLSSPTKRQQKVYDTVLNVQKYAMGLVKPGVLIKDYEKEVRQYMGEKLRELGLIKTIEAEEVNKYYPHATSHFLGLNVHDVADYDMPLETNMVITVEPGIYIPEESIGVRLEDDVILTDTGIKNLSSDLPKKLMLT
jgi:Xaa-Pro aminopeptidase